MLIRSQNNRALINIDLVHIGIVGSRVIASERLEYEEDCMTLGVYSSSEKAIKVLDMLENQYLYFGSNYHTSCGVFQMPADEELEDEVERGTICPYCGGTETTYSEYLDNWHCETCHQEFLKWR